MMGLRIWRCIDALEGIQHSLKLPKQHKNISVVEKNYPMDFCLPGKWQPLRVSYPQNNTLGLTTANVLFQHNILNKVEMPYHN